MALYDTQGYSRKLSEYLNRKHFLLDNRLFTQQEKLVEFLKDNTVDVLLLGEEVEIDSVPYLGQASRVILLSEGNTVAEGDGPPRVFKYQSAEKLLREIFQLMEEDMGFTGIMTEGVGGQTEFYGVYCPYGQPLPIQRLFAVNGSREKKSLYLNLELLCSFGIPGVQWSTGEDSRGMSELIFYLKQRNEKLPGKLRTLIQSWEGVDYLYPVEDYRDLYSMDRDDVDCLLELLANGTDYEQIVFDIGFLNDTALYLLYCCDRIFIPRAKTSREKSQQSALEKLFIREGLSEVMENIQYVSA